MLLPIKDSLINTLGSLSAFLTGTHNKHLVCYVTHGKLHISGQLFSSAAQQQHFQAVRGLLPAYSGGRMCPASCEFVAMNLQPWIYRKHQIWESNQEQQSQTQLNHKSQQRRRCHAPQGWGLSLGVIRRCDNHTGNKTTPACWKKALSDNISQGKFPFKIRINLNIFRAPRSPWGFGDVTVSI